MMKLVMTFVSIYLILGVTLFIFSFVQIYASIVKLSKEGKDLEKDDMQNVLNDVATDYGVSYNPEKDNGSTAWMKIILFWPYYIDTILDVVKSITNKMEE